MNKIFSKRLIQKDPEVAWDLIIKPKVKLLDLNLKEVWLYKDLLLLFVKRDFIAQYKQTVLGPIWHFIQPILTTLMYLVIFTRIARIPTNGIPPVLFYLSGITIWNYFSVCLTSTSNSFLSNANIFGKVYFPRLIAPIAVIISNILRFGIQFLLLIAVLVWYSFHGYSVSLSVALLIIPILVILVAGLALGIGIIMSSLTTKYRDFNVLLSFAVQLLMYVTPVVYPLSYIKKFDFEWIIRINPLTPIVEAFRYSLFRQGSFSFQELLYSCIFMVVTLLFGAILYNKVEKSFIDTV